MKAIVLGVRNGRAALLLEDGTTTYRRMQCSPGQRVEVPAENGIIASMPRSIKATAAAAALFLVLGGGYIQNTLPVSYITMDVNPSMEYALNRSDRVVEVSALNKDAEAIVGELSVSGESIGEAVEKAEDVMEKHGYLREGGSVLFSVSSVNDKRADKLEAELSDTMDKQVVKKGEDNLAYSVVRVSKNERNEAKKNSISAGRFKQMVSVIGEGSSVDEGLISEFRKKPVDELIGSTASQSKASNEKKESKADSGDYTKDTAVSYGNENGDPAHTEGSAAPQSAVNGSKQSKTKEKANVSVPTPANQAPTQAAVQDEAAKQAAPEPQNPVKPEAPKPSSQPQNHPAGQAAQAPSATPSTPSASDKSSSSDSQPLLAPPVPEMPPTDAQASQAASGQGGSTAAKSQGGQADIASGNSNGTAKEEAPKEEFKKEDASKDGKKEDKDNSKKQVADSKAQEEKPVEAVSEPVEDNKEIKEIQENKEKPESDVPSEKQDAPIADEPSERAQEEEGERTFDDGAPSEEELEKADDSKAEDTSEEPASTEMSSEEECEPKLEFDSEEEAAATEDASEEESAIEDASEEESATEDASEGSDSDESEPLSDSDECSIDENADSEPELLQ